MRLKNFEIALETFFAHPPDGIVKKSTSASGLSDGEGGAFFTVGHGHSEGSEDYDPSFFNIFQIKNANVVSEKLTYSGSLSAKTEGALEIAGQILMITKNR